MTAPKFTFYLGTHVIQWLWRVKVPLFVSHRQLKGRVSAFPKATCDWALDSGGFTELSMFDGWKTTPEEYVDKMQKYSSELGSLKFASPQDWMCEPFMLEKTGLTVDAHQKLTVENLVALRELAPELPIIPVVQGWTLDDYLKCVDLYGQYGIDLSKEDLVGLGSVCRRQATDDIGEIVTTLHALGLNLHGYGVKIKGLAKYSEGLVSADSMAWSLAGRRSERLPGCEGHKNCANCIVFAMQWREKVLNGIAS